MTRRVATLAFLSAIGGLVAQGQKRKATEKSTATFDVLEPLTPLNAGSVLSFYSSAGEVASVSARGVVTIGKAYTPETAIAEIFRIVERSMREEREYHQQRLDDLLGLIQTQSDLIDHQNKLLGQYAADRERKACA